MKTYKVEGFEPVVGPPHDSQEAGPFDLNRAEQAAARLAEDPRGFQFVVISIDDEDEAD